MGRINNCLAPLYELIHILFLFPPIVKCEREGHMIFGIIRLKGIFFIVFLRVLAWTSLVFILHLGLDINPSCDTPMKKSPSR